MLFYAHTESDIDSKLEERNNISLIARLYETDMVDAPTNFYYSMRLLTESLEENLFNSEEINLLRVLISKIIEKRKGAKKELFKALHDELGK